MSFMRMMLKRRTLEKIFSAITFFFLMSIMLNKGSPPDRINQIPNNVITHRHTPNNSLTCGYQNCPQTKKDCINIHLIPHSHNDPGYKKTMDEYFYGLRNDIQNVTINAILTNVIKQLTLNKDRKFVYVEMVYFRKWWQIQTESTRETVRELVQNGRLEFLNGGWCVNDEATTNYADIIDQMSLGLNFLAETFGECGRPKVAFQTDTFGHSREQALLSSLMGFDALFVGRVDREDKNRRIEAKEMEMVWYGSDLPGNHPSIFTGITYNIFDPPPGFCFDNVCGDTKISEPIDDDVDSKTYNVEKRVDEFLAYIIKQAEAYKTNNIAVYMGSDYTYKDAEIWFDNMDKLIKHVNKRQENGHPYNIFYSTPSCYVKALNDAELAWPTKKDDFFPYHWELFAYWTGYFSSRPALKYMVRQGSSLLNTCKQMASVIKLKGNKNKGDISLMKEAMAVLQHHDGITGTHSQRVHDDYVRLLHKGVEECTKTLNSYYQEEMPINDDAKDFKFSVKYCHKLNTSQCETTEKKNGRFVVNIYNPLGQYINKYIKVPVTRKSNELIYKFKVIDSSGNIVPSQLMPIPSFVSSIPGRNSTANQTLIFLATKVPPLGSKSYYVETSMGRGTRDPPIPVPLWDSSLSDNELKDLKISNEKISVVISNETGLISSVTFDGNKTVNLDQQFYWYNGNGDNCSFTTKTASGVYVFNPLGNTSLSIKIETKNVVAYRGDLVEEIHQTFNNYIGQIIRLYKTENYIEFDWVIGPVPIKDGDGKEIITRYTTNFKNNGEFYTDANGRQSVLRIRNERSTYNLSGNDSVASNYYPITSHAFLSDSKTGYRINILTDRAQGGGSIEDGQLELLLHRRFVQQDVCLFKEPLDEMAYGEGLVIRGTHTLFLEDTKDVKTYVQGSSTLRSLVLERSRQPIISFIPMKYTSEQWLRFFRSNVKLLSRPLPENVNILTLEPIDRSGYEKEYILRLEHIYNIGEHPILSNPVEVSLKGLFEGFNIEQIEETTLDGSLMKSDTKRLNWKTTDIGVDANFHYHKNPITSLDLVELLPMDIRTFVIKLVAKQIHLE